jgi:hypothetical protein
MQDVGNEKGPNEIHESFVNSFEFEPWMINVSWTEQEVKLLLHIVSRYGKDWNVVASNIPAKSPEDCKAFYHFLAELEGILENKGLIKRLDDPPRKKRKRRKANTIDRKYKCPYPDCPRAYGTEGALKYHFKSKHKDQEYLPPPPNRGQNSDSVDISPIAPIVVPGRAFSFPMSFTSQDPPMMGMIPEYTTFPGLNINTIASHIYQQESKDSSPKISLLTLPNINLGNGHIGEGMGFDHISLQHDLNMNRRDLGDEDMDQLKDELDEDLDDDLEND